MTGETPSESSCASSSGSSVSGSTASKRLVAFKKRTVAFEKQFGSVSVREFDSLARLTASASLPLLVSFPSVHITSTLVCNYVAEQLHLELVGEIFSSEFPTRAVVTDGQPSHGLRLVGNDKVIVLLCEFKIPPQCLGDICDAVLDLADRRNLSVVTCVEGLPKNAPSPSSSSSSAPALKTHFLTDSESLFERLASVGAEPVPTAMLDGPTGGILARAPYHKTNVLVLMAEVDPLDPGAKVSVELVRLVSSLLAFEVDLAPMEAKANQLEDKVKELVAHETQARYGGASSMYM